MDNQTEKLPTAENGDNARQKVAAENSNSKLVNNDENLFEKVWVKLEVIEDEEIELKDVEDPDTIKEKPNLKRKNAKKPSKKWPAKHLKCDQCDYKTGYKQCLAMHVLTHSDEKPFTCSVFQCFFKTKYSVALKHHINIKHGGNEILHKCGICSYTTNYKWNLTLHKKKHDPANQYKCSECDYSTAYKHNAKKHSLIHNKNEGLSYYCDKCPFVSKHEGLITRHLAKVHLEVSDNDNKCEYCPFSAKTKYVVNKHKRNSRQNNTLFCFNCDFQTTYRCALREHKQSHRNETKPILEINTKINENKDSEIKIKEDSNNEVTSELKSKNQTEKKDSEPKINDETNTGVISKLKNKNQTKKKDTKAKINDEPNNKVNSKPKSKNKTEKKDSEPIDELDTGVIWQQQDNQYVLDPSCDVKLNNIQVRESSIQEQPFQCIDCDYTARFKAAVQRHYQRKHMQSRPYKCIHCDFTTKTKEQIADHNKRSQTKQQICFCGFTSSLKCQFTMHGKEHHPFKCGDCDYTCKKKADLVHHYSVVHLGKRWICRYCDFKANTKDSFMNHEAKHTGERPFQCELCDYASTRKCLVKNHMNRVHKASMAQKIIDDSKIESLKKKTEKTEVFIVNHTLSD